MIQMQKSNRFFYLSLFIFFTFFVLLTSLFIKIIPLTFHHTVYYCREAINSVSIALPDSTPVLFSGAILLIVLSGIGIFSVQLLRTKLYLTKILKNNRPLTKKIKTLADQLKISDKIDLVSNKQISSFCYGIISPRICISLQLVRSLNSQELKAVLAHERSHLNNRDPLKILLGQVITTMFFFIPVLKDLHNFFALTKEIEADKAAIKSLGGSIHLKNALSKILIPFTPNFIPVAAFTQLTNIEARVLSLKGSPADLKVSYHRIFISLIIVGTTLAILTTPVYSIGNETSHEYVMSPYGNQCATSASEEIVTHDLFSSSSQTSSINYSANP
jgi:Zn-dependent protease with chaperone function